MAIVPVFDPYTGAADGGGQSFNWDYKTLGSAQAHFDPASILNNYVDTPGGYAVDITSAGANTNISTMASWVWPMKDIQGNLMFDGTAAWNFLTAIREVSGTAASDGCALIGIIDRPNPTDAGCNGFGVGLSWSSTGSANKQPRCWILNSGSFVDNVDSGTNNDSVYCVLDHGRRKLLFREFSGSGVKSDGVTPSNDFAFITGSNIDMSAASSASSPFYAVFAVGSLAAVTGLNFTVRGGWFGQPKPAAGYKV